MEKFIHFCSDAERPPWPAVAAILWTYFKLLRRDESAPSKLKAVLEAIAWFATRAGLEHSALHPPIAAHREGVAGALAP